ncbi:hypothetical protein [Ferrimonas lipolytica]|uniref:Cyanophycinase n=1 Tax=Ferrimonas lipolytica TaxID=2724191 RepID=A0A6H1UEX8_9GAMM|nr:hypothetical protein [Ferrimonas lipolytica]QIZ76766.1 hypothetical protein HER31_07695 [Ferrimonas lipolytica]
MNLFRLLLSLLALVCSSSNASVALLIGSELKLCSSLSPQYCHRGSVDRLALQQSKRHRLFSPARLTNERWLNISWLSATERQQGLVLFADTPLPNKLNNNELLDWFQLNPAILQWFQQLQPQQVELLFDLIEVAPIDRYGAPLLPQFWPESSTVAGAVSILNSINQLSADVAQLSYLTAAQRDPFAAAQRYGQMLPPQSQWLPLDGSLIHARSDNRCSALTQYRQQFQSNVDRQRLYRKLASYQLGHCRLPAKTLQQLETTSTLVVADGDPQRLRHALFLPDGQPTPELLSIAQRFNSSTLAIAAIGKSNVLFDWIRELEPQTASRQPQWRLLATEVSLLSTQLQLATLPPQQALILGVDNDTAALISANNIKVIGDNGVWLGQRHPGDSARFSSHYIQTNDSATLAPLVISLANPDPEPRSNEEVIFNHLTHNSAGFHGLTQQLCHSLASQGLGHIATKDKTIGVLLNVGAATQFSHQQGQAWCSYRNLEVEFGSVAAP